MKQRLVLAMAAALLLSPVAAARADTFPVTSTADSGQGSLREAIADANAGADPDLIDATGVVGTINLQSELPRLSEDVEIGGPGASALTVRRDGGGDYRIFSVDFGVAAELSGLTAANGLDDTQGGGIGNFGGMLTVANSVVRDNTVTGSQGGGGLFTRNGGSLTVANSTVAENDATEDGGGIRATFDSDLTVVNSTVTGNTAAGGGGGIASAQQGSDVTILNSTVAANSAPEGANLRLVAFDDTKVLRSTILSDPVGGGENCVFFDDTPVSQGHNLADDASCGLDVDTDLPNTDPSVGPLVDNGGPTPTMALAPGSPAIDKGVSGDVSADQRGEPRPSDFGEIANAPGGDGADIGAFELQPPVEPPPSNEFSFGKVKKNKRKGTAKLTVEVPGPGELALARTKRVKPAAESTNAAEKVRLTIRSRGKARKRLDARGKARVRARVTYTPTGGEPNTKAKRIRLRKRG
ncbi:MAG: choice-of-anchor Q domain-containing protein [Solirubrobacterales bacterium]